MIARRNAAALAFIGGAALALLGGCAAQSPATYYEPVPPRYVDPAAVSDRWRAYFEQQNAARNAVQNAVARQLQPDDGPVVQAPPRRGRRHEYSPPSSDDDGPVISDNPPARTPAPVPQAPVDADCPPGSWWDICRWL
jgi:hypothetical protein